MKATAETHIAGQQVVDGNHQVVEHGYSIISEGCKKLCHKKLEETKNVHAEVAKNTNIAI